jgi:uncharacterized damage-inducible protein DinB
MTAMIDDLIRHKWHSNAALLGAIGQNAAAMNDEELRKLLHHILIANRYWLSRMRDIEFFREAESRISESLDDLIARYRQTETEEMEWLLQASDADFDRVFQIPRLPGQDFSATEAIMQVVMHSLGHRAQCAMRLRSLGGTPPPTDFVLWLKDRPAPVWPS